MRYEPLRTLRTMDGQPPSSFTRFACDLSFTIELIVTFDVMGPQQFSGGLRDTFDQTIRRHDEYWRIERLH